MSAAGTALVLSAAMEFDHPVTVHADGTVSDGPADLYAPEVWHDGLDDLGGYDREQWELLTGYTGQHGYSGPVMHASEFIGGRMAEDILSTPGVYVAVVVYALSMWPDDDPDPEPAGWAMARWIGGER